MNLRDFPFLACSGGSYSPAGGGPSVLVGPLEPFPYSPAPDPGACTPLPPQLPLASAGADFQLASGAVGTLDASGSFDPSGGALTYNWTQTAGPPVLLSDPGLSLPTFEAPVLAAGDPAVSLGFELFVTNALGGARDAVVVTVAAPSLPSGTPATVPDPTPDTTPDPTPASGKPSGGCGTAPGSVAPGFALALAALLLHPRLRRAIRVRA